MSHVQLRIYSLQHIKNAPYYTLYTQYLLSLFLFVSTHLNTFDATKPTYLITQLNIISLFFVFQNILTLQKITHKSPNILRKTKYFRGTSVCRNTCWLGYAIYISLYRTSRGVLSRVVYIYAMRLRRLYGARADNDKCLDTMYMYDTYDVRVICVSVYVLINSACVCVCVGVWISVIKY